MNCRFRVVGRLDAASRVQEGTVTISRTAGTFAVRPLRRRREYLLPLSTVATLVDTHRVAAGLIPAPSGDRRHVFDCPDGLRLIVSRERLPDGHCGVHVSASLDPDSAAYAWVRHGAPDRAALLAMVVRRWSTPADPTRTLELLGFSPRGVPHFMCWSPQ